MRFKRRSKNHVHLENIALTDIIMNLFLFFVISFGLTSSLASKNTRPESPLKVSLPSVSDGSSERVKANHEILLTKIGEILWDGTTIDLDHLKQNLARRESKTGQIVLKADRDASVQSLVSVLETVRATGASNVSLQTEILPQKK